MTQRGHEVVAIEKAVADPVMLHIEPETRVIHAAGDPAADRHAASLDA